MKLIDIIKKNVGEDVATQEYIQNLDYHTDTLNDEAIFIGTVQDGINRANIYSVSCGGWHISSATAEFFTEEDPTEEETFIEANDEL